MRRNLEWKSVFHFITLILMSYEQGFLSLDTRYVHRCSDHHSKYPSTSNCSRFARFLSRLDFGRVNIDTHVFHSKQPISLKLLTMSARSTGGHFLMTAQFSNLSPLSFSWTSVSIIIFNPHLAQMHIRQKQTEVTQSDLVLSFLSQGLSYMYLHFSVLSYRLFSVYLKVCHYFCPCGIHFSTCFGHIFLLILCTRAIHRNNFFNYVSS